MADDDQKASAKIMRVIHGITYAVVVVLGIMFVIGMSNVSLNRTGQIGVGAAMVLAGASAFMAGYRR